MPDARLEVTRTAPDLIELTTAGQIGAPMMEAALTRLVDDMEGMLHANMLIRDAGMNWPSLGAIGVELRHWGQLMGMIRKIDRIALLTDQAWLRNTAAIESALIPGITIRSFDPDEEGAARAWLSGGEPGVTA